MKTKKSLIIAAFTLCGAAIASTVSAAPLSSAASPSATGASSAQSDVEQAGWQRRRHCRRGHCGWRRVWVPGVSIYVGERRRGRHHRRNYNRY